MNIKIQDIVIKYLQDFTEEEQIDVKEVLDIDTKLFGGNGIFSSIQLVAFVTGVEEAMEDQMDIMLTIADEKAMSRRVSPFSSVRHLVAYIEEKIATEDE